MNAKEIAEMLQEIASFFASDKGCTNAIYDAQIAITNELDPPEPKPLLADAKVGDWVEHKKSKEQGRITYISSANYNAIEVKLYDQDELETYTTSDFNDEFRKLDPSEVVIRIGCLSGTVQRRSYFDTDKFFSLKNPEMEMAAAVINIDALDTPTRELVESLLRAQEEK